MEIIGAAGILAMGTASYNRENFMFDIDQRQRKRFKALEFRVQRAAQCREDIEDLLPPVTVITGDVAKISAFLLVLGVMFIGTADLPAGTAQWIRCMWMTSTVSAIGFLFVSKWLAFHAIISAQFYATKMLLQSVRLPIPAREELELAVRRASEFENEDAQDVLRIPIVQSKLRSTSLPRIPSAYDSANVPASDVDHIVVFRQLRLQWRTYEVYTRMTLVAGAYALMHSLSFYVVAYSLLLKQFWTAASCVVILSVCANGIMAVDFAKMNVPLLLIYHSAPYLVLISVPIDRYEMIPLAFFVQSLWPIMFLYSTHNTSSSSWRFLHFIDVFKTFGSQNILCPIQREVFFCIERLSSLKEECAIRRKDKNLDLGDRLVLQNASVLINRSLNQLWIMLPSQKAPVANPFQPFVSKSARDLKRMVMKEEVLVTALTAEYGNMQEPSKKPGNSTRDQSYDTPYRSVRAMCLLVSFVYFANCCYEIYNAFMGVPYAITEKPYSLDPNKRMLTSVTSDIDCERWGTTPVHSRFLSCEDTLIMHNATHVLEFVDNKWQATNPFSSAWFCDGKQCRVAEPEHRTFRRQLTRDPAGAGTYFHVDPISGEVVAYEGPPYVAYANFRPFPNAAAISCSSTHRTVQRVIADRKDGASGGRQHVLAVLGPKLLKVLDASSGHEIQHKINITRPYVDVCIHEEKVYLLNEFSQVEVHALTT
eukprot:GEMP01013904.1.p1 GENE.GEMP01013904.1~~GEMP01013904.1.p1  ORF type:complete len:707 (+),score=130.96 GEMP01013904.1:502-2622(+)